ncbi:RluA family pseudouridine synthase [Saccharopolyspora sp. CA-218241]|uniref:RluA family pseudouridine synthase n=1 Tax=Saccharopolyspora sp. CA-218241 TaxID=3240027 RepID=UPI003D98D7CB
MRRTPRSPLPPRDGVDATRIRLPAEGPWATVLEHLVERLPMLPADRIEAMLRAGEVVGEDGPVGPAAPFVPHASVWFHRDLPTEVPVPFGLDVLHRDEDLVVVDKPHFLATTPRGGHVAQTALVRLRRELGLPDLSPAHRLDRMTAGVVLFVVRPELRGAYQGLFQDRAVRKVYEAIAPHDPAVALPRTVRSRIVKERGVHAARELPGEPNSETRVELLERRGGLGRYRLLPRTGRTHQLRVHLNSLGLPIVGDELYPVVAHRAPDDFTDPLRLLARSLEFTDPVSGRPRRFDSARALEWPSGTHPIR